jgi:uncharacterized membrane protein YdbT with pleckstrin-like domain
MAAHQDESTLIPGENVLRRIRPHWIILIAPTAFGLVTTTAFIYLMIAVATLDAPFSTYLGWALALVYAWFFTRHTLTGIVRWATTIYLFTDQRIITRQGLLKISGESIALNRIHSIQFQKTLLERVLGSGSLKIESAAENDILVQHVTHVEEVHREMYAQIHRAEEHRTGDDPINFNSPNH